MQKGSCPRRHMHGMLEGQVCCHEDCGHGGCLLKGDREGHRDQQGAVSQDMRSQGTCHLPKYSLACSGPIGTCVRSVQSLHMWVDRCSKKVTCQTQPMFSSMSTPCKTNRCSEMCSASRNVCIDVYKGDNPCTYVYYYIINMCSNNWTVTLKGTVWASA